MERNPKKSKALIITFIIVLILVVGLYFLFKKTTMFSNNGTVSRIFGQLPVTKEKKPLVTNPTQPVDSQGKLTDSKGRLIDSQGRLIDAQGRLIDENGNLIDAQGRLIDEHGNLIDTKGNIIDTKGNIIKINPGGGGSYTPYIPQLNPIPVPIGGKVVIPGGGGGGNGGGPITFETCFNGIKDQNETGVDTGGICGIVTPTKTQCNDGIDNDKDGSIDSADGGCHTDFDQKNVSSYDSTINDESQEGTNGGSGGGGSGGNPNKKTTTLYCPEIVPEYTEAEKATLADLTRQFYRLSATLYTADDVTAEYSMGKGYDDLTAKAKDLTIQCKDQTSAVSYRGPKRKKDNPYFSSPSANTISYATGDLTSSTMTPKMQRQWISCGGGGMWENFVNQIQDQWNYVWQDYDSSKSAGLFTCPNPWDQYTDFDTYLDSTISSRIWDVYLSYLQWGYDNGGNPYGLSAQSLKDWRAYIDYVRNNKELTDFESMFNVW